MAGSDAPAAAALLDRAIRITLKRKTSDEPVARFRHRIVRAESEPLRAALERWASEHTATLSAAEPELPEQLDDRAAEGWEPLLALADLAGPDIGQLVRRAAVALAPEPDQDEDDHGLRLLIALRAVFGDASMLPSATIVASINDMDELPFGAWRDGKGLDPRGLGRLLSPFGVRSRKIRLGASTAQGYRREQFTDAWRRYTRHAEHGAKPSAAPPNHTSPGTSGTTTAHSQASEFTDPEQPAHVPHARAPSNPRQTRDVPDEAPPTALPSAHHADAEPVTDSIAASEPAKGAEADDLANALEIVASVRPADAQPNRTDTAQSAPEASSPYIGGACPDPLRCKYLHRFPTGPWTCAYNHPRQAVGA